VPQARLRCRCERDCPDGEPNLLKIRDRSLRNLISNVLFVVAAILLAYVVYAYIQDRRDNDTPEAPPSIPGKAELKNVRDALVAQGLDVDYGKEVGRVNGLTAVGQQLITDDVSVYVFLFSSPEEREAETESLDLENLAMVDSFGESIETGVLQAVANSNVLAVSDGASEELQSKIDAAIRSLP
jgi:hypothetical protein